MSSSSYYSVRDVWRAQLANVENGIAAAGGAMAALSAIRSQLRTAVAAGAGRETHRTVHDVQFDRATIAVLEAIDVEKLAVRAQAKTIESPLASGQIDLSGLLTPEPASTAEYLDGVRSRARALFPLSTEDDAKVAAVLAQADELVDRPLEEARSRLDPAVTELAVRLHEGETAAIEDDYFSYLAACALAEVVPQRLTLLQMREQTSRLLAELDRREQAEALQRTVRDSLGEVGLTLAGSTVLNGRSGVLLTDAADDNCALFLVEDGESLLFTTVLAERPSSLSAERRAAVKGSIENFCSKKRKLVDEVLAAKGVLLDTGFDRPADPATAEFSPDFAQQVAVRHSGGRTKRSAAGPKHAEA